MPILNLNKQKDRNQYAESDAEKINRQTTMTINKKKAQIKKLAIQMLKESFEAAKKKVDKALNSGAIDIDSWNPNSNPMIVPQAIVTAILIDESKQYDGSGTSFEKQQKRDIKIIGYSL